MNCCSNCSAANLLSIHEYMWYDCQSFELKSFIGITPSVLTVALYTLCLPMNLLVCRVTKSIMEQCFIVLFICLVVYSVSETPPDFLFYWYAPLGNRNRLLILRYCSLNKTELLDTHPNVYARALKL